MIVNKKPAEMLGVMIVESGWGSMIPCAIIAHLAKDGPAAKSGRLNVGDQILSVNGTSLVGLPLLECQNIIKVRHLNWNSLFDCKVDCFTKLQTTFKCCNWHLSVGRSR